MARNHSTTEIFTAAAWTAAFYRARCARTLFFEACGLQRGRMPLRKLPIIYSQEDFDKVLGGVRVINFFPVRAGQKMFFGRLTQEFTREAIDFKSFANCESKSPLRKG